MRVKFLTLALAFATLASAQEVTITSHRQILKGTESSAYNPVLSADGQQLLFSGDNYTGLKLYDFNDNVTTKISEADMAGYHPEFSMDGKSVYYMSQTRENMRLYRAMNNYSVSSKSTKVIADGMRRMNAPIVLKNGVAVQSERGVEYSGAKGTETFVYAEGSELAVVKNGVEKRFSPVATNYHYLWESLSPNKDKVLFYAGGKGLYVVDLNGKVLADLGKYTEPVWYGNDYIVAQKTTDDGHQFESSKLVLLKADGTFVKDLTKPESMAMNPTASAKAGRIVYNTIDGRMFVMEINIK